MMTAFVIVISLLKPFGPYRVPLVVTHQCPSTWLEPHWSSTTSATRSQAIRDVASNQFLVALGDEPATVGERVVAFAQSKLGEKVGDGECASLAAAAVAHAGAIRPREGSPWGVEVKNLAEVRPGDILQFENVIFMQKRVREDGRIVRLTIKSPKHSAIVSSVSREGKETFVKVLHQNAGFTKASDDVKKVVQEWTFALSEKKGGVLKAFRPQGRAAELKPEAE